MIARGKEIWREGMADLSGEKGEGGGRKLKKCRSRSSSSATSGGEDKGGPQLKRCRSISTTPLSVSQNTPCVFSYNRDGMGPVLLSVDNFDEKTYRNKFCKNCRVELFEQGDNENGDCGSEGRKHKSPPPPLRQITPSKITPSKSSLIPFGEMIVAVGSTVYVLGAYVLKPEQLLEKDTHPGCFFGNVLYFDTNHEEEGWKRGPDLLNARGSGKAVAVEGKIYVFGGNDLEKAREPWGEVLDPIKNEWKPLPPPLEYLDDKELEWPIVAYGGPSEKRIMLGGEIKYLYHVKSGTWEQLYWGVCGSPRFKPIGVGNIVYYTEETSLFAANMKTKKLYQGKIKGSKLGDNRLCRLCDILLPEEPHLVHLGGKEFCFFTFQLLPNGHTKVCCTKFRVSKRSRPPPLKSDLSHREPMGGLKGSVVGIVSCVFDQPLDDNWPALLLEGMPGGIKDLGGSVSKHGQEVAVKETKQRRKRRKLQQEK